MSAPAFVGRDAELRALIEALKRPGSIIELIAQVGMGKTALLKKMTSDNSAPFDGAIEYFAGSPRFPFSEAIDAIGERFRAALGHSLLIIDDADLLDPDQTMEGIKRLETGPWRFSTVVASQRGLGLGTPIRPTPIEAESCAELLRSAFDGDLDAVTIEQLLPATRGNPRLARILGDQ